MGGKREGGKPQWSSGSVVELLCDFGRLSILCPGFHYFKTDKKTLLLSLKPS